MIVRLLLLSALLVALFIYVDARPVTEPQPVPSQLIKIDHQGDIVPIWSGPWACVADTRTGLLWEVKTDSETIHDGYWTYSWFKEGIGAANKGDCYFEAERCDVTDLLRRVNESRLCGKTNWRLPSAVELQTLLYHQGRPGDPLINKGFFPHTKRGDYWSADYQVGLDGIFSHLGQGAKAVNFHDGQTRALPYRNAAFLRLVSD